MAADVSRHEGADALRERLEALLNSRAASSSPEGPFPYDVPRQALRDEFESLLARVHSLERALQEIQKLSVPNWHLDRAKIIARDGLRAVVLEGAARQEQTQDLGGNVNVARGADVETQR